MDEVVYPNLELEVKFNITQKDHSGYCYFPKDETVREYTETNYYPLLKLIKLGDVYTNRTVDLGNPKLYYYTPENTNKGKPLSFCCGTSYSIKSAKVIKKDNILDLLER